ncbi:MAG: hypothetical protein OXD31_15005 [Chloroflexi bacterium]|nr:hypothetical protein [Chloroflexota bacterium]
MEVPSTGLAEILFVDSGGYEVTKDHDIMQPMYSSPEPRKWTYEKYLAALSSIETIMPTIVTAYDHPDERRPISEQVANAFDTFKAFPEWGCEILLKPENDDDEFLNIQGVIAEVPEFNRFDVVGMTEAELGESVLERMYNITQVRLAMANAGVVKPLHIFGSLDPVCTPLYFLAGADIFDGLSWLRFSYRDDLAIYHRNRVPLEFGAEEGEKRGSMRSYSANLHYLSDLTLRLKRYLIDGDEQGRLGRHGAFFAEALDNLRVQLPKGVV